MSTKFDQYLFKKLRGADGSGVKKCIWKPNKGMKLYSRQKEHMYVSVCDTEFENAVTHDSMPYIGMESACTTY